MQRLAALAALVLAALLNGTPAGAEDAAPAADAPPGRFTMVPADGGFVRLDTRTGAVAHCRRETPDPGSAWRCATVPEEEMKRPDRFGELGEQIDSLGREIAALRMRVDALEQAEKARAAADAPPALTQDDEMRRSLDFSEELMRRFLGLVQEMKRQDAEGRT